MMHFVLIQVRVLDIKHFHVQNVAERHMDIARPYALFILDIFYEYEVLLPWYFFYNLYIKFYEA